MMKPSIYTLVNQYLESGQKLVLAKIIRRTGSTPRDVGSMCIITEDNRIVGTVGGGLLEYKVQKKAAQMLKSGPSFIYRFTLSNDDLAQNGMICGGDADLFLEVLSPKNSRTREIFKAIDRKLALNRPVTLVTRIKDGLDPLADGLHMLQSDDGTCIGSLTGFRTGLMNGLSTQPCRLIDPADSGDSFFIEHLTQPPRLFLFGAGHVSTCVAPLARTVGFNITVIDDRPEFAAKERFPDADQVIVSDFKEAFDTVTFAENAYILIITRGHLHDKSVLEMALNTKAVYIGMIGSIKKRNIIYSDLLKQGVAKERLEWVCSPVGIDINAQTPEEIAVSIVAELIRKRAPEKPLKKLIL
jgi:xanthine dehydrogenase accessory factor